MRSDAKLSEQKEQTTEIDLGDGYTIKCPFDLVCSISQAEVAAIPLKFVDDKSKEEKQTYDAKNILTHLRRNPISPFTRQPVSHLVFDEKLEQKRCDFFNDQLKKVNQLNKIDQDLKRITAKLASPENKNDRQLRNQRNYLKKKKNKMGDIPKSAREQIERLSRASSQQEKNAINQRANQYGIFIEGPGFENHQAVVDEDTLLHTVCYYTALSYSASNILFSSLFRFPFNRPPTATFSLGVGPLMSAVVLHDPDIAIQQESIYSSIYMTMVMSMAVDVGTRIATGILGVPLEHAQVLAPAAVTFALTYGDRVANGLSRVGRNIYGFFSRNNQPNEFHEHGLDNEPLPGRRPR